MLEHPDPLTVDRQPPDKFRAVVLDAYGVIRDHTTGRPSPGVIETMDTLRALGLLVGLASDRDDTFDLLTEQTYEIVCVSENLPGPPTPFLVFECCKRLNVYPTSEVIYVAGDADHVQCGLHAGCWTVAFANDYDGRLSLMQMGVNWILDSVNELPDMLDGFEIESTPLPRFGDRRLP